MINLRNQLVNCGINLKIGNVAKLSLLRITVAASTLELSRALRLLSFQSTIRYLLSVCKRSELVSPSISGKCFRTYDFFLVRRWPHVFFDMCI
jgi:hypothetical protein